MPIPDRETIKAALIQYILDYGGTEHALRPPEIYDGLAEHFTLTQDDRARERTAETFWENEVRWARQALVEEGYILPLAQSQWGVWKLTNPVRKYVPHSANRIERNEPQVRLEFEAIHNDLVDEGVFSPVSVSDAREIIIRAIVQRRGQHTFREKLLLAYGFACCVTEEPAVQVLEAAHIIPYQGEATNHIQNGLLLRSDIHTLFDLRLLSIEPANYTVVTAPVLKSTSYANYAGSRIRVPETLEQRPSSEALRIHRESCNF